MAVRCAIYTRLSHDDRADAALGAIERQRELCGAYIASQTGEGWEALPDGYDDPGRSGGSTNRPALQRLLTAVDAGEVDVVVVYKIDRLSRSLRDFLNLVDRFDQAGVTFVSVTQSFSTTTSLGRLVINILLSFAQFEREMTADRIRERNAQARARGLWTSGPPPFGYMLDPFNRGRLLVHPERAALVRWTYQRFVELRSLAAVARELNEAGHRNRQGRLFEGRLVKAIVSRRVYRGELPHRGGHGPGKHAALVDERLWRKAQAVLDEIGAKPHRW